MKNKTRLGLRGNSMNPRVSIEVFITSVEGKKRSNGGGSRRHGLGTAGENKSARRKEGT